MLCQGEVEYSHLRHFCGDCWGEDGTPGTGDIMKYRFVQTGQYLHLACSLASRASWWSQVLLAMKK